MEWLLTPEFLPGELHGQKRQVDYTPWGCKELDRTEHIHIQAGEKTIQLDRCLRTCPAFIRQATCFILINAQNNSIS